MKKEKEAYLTPELSVSVLYTESFVCLSNLGSIVATEEEEDTNEWPSVN